MDLLFILLSFACSYPEQGCPIFDSPGYVRRSTATFVTCILKIELKDISGCYVCHILGFLYVLSKKQVAIRVASLCQYRGVVNP
jgi:hypothetical protein